MFVIFYGSDTHKTSKRTRYLKQIQSFIVKHMQKAKQMFIRLFVG